MSELISKATCLFKKASVSAISNDVVVVDVVAALFLVDAAFSCCTPELCFGSGGLVTTCISSFCACSAHKYLPKVPFKDNLHVVHNGFLHVTQDNGVGYFLHSIQVL